MHALPDHPKSLRPLVRAVRISQTPADAGTGAQDDRTHRKAASARMLPLAAMMMAGLSFNAVAEDAAPMALARAIAPAMVNRLSFISCLLKNVFELLVSSLFRWQQVRPARLHTLKSQTVPNDPERRRAPVRSD